MMTKFVNEYKQDDGHTWKVGLSLAYVSLLESIAERDLESIGRMCERTLYREFADSFEELSYKRSIKILNRDESASLEEVAASLKMDVVDVGSYFGANIDR